ncbi:MAG: hypothetical protein CMF59_10010 [Leptospiraceae bacterium]|nr:hypothetical protein [Leptospiraceae bacterium]
MASISQSRLSFQPEKGTFRSTGAGLLLAALLMGGMLLLPGCSSAQEKESAPAGLGLLDAMVEYHKETGTHMDGPRCPMYPSCSAYAYHALRKHGYFGFLLALERLFFREGGELSDRYPLAPRNLSESPRYLDPLEASTGERPRLADPRYLSH